MRKCTECETNKTDSEFRLALKRGKYKYRSKCIKCERKYNITYHYVHREEKNNRTRKWRENNADYVKQYSKEYETKNKEKRYEKNKIWSKNNLDKKREKQRKRRAISKQINENFSVSDEQIIMKIFGNKCFNCGSQEKLEIDHHYPLSKGNPLTLLNAVLLCESCNCSKKDKIPENFYSINKLNELKIIQNNIKVKE